MGLSRIRTGAERPNDVLMETVVCASCGQRFAIHHDPTRQDVEVADDGILAVKNNSSGTVSGNEITSKIQLAWLQ